MNEVTVYLSTHTVQYIYPLFEIADLPWYLDAWNGIVHFWDTVWPLMLGGLFQGIGIFLMVYSLTRMWEQFRDR